MKLTQGHYQPGAQGKIKVVNGQQFALAGPKTKKAQGQDSFA